MNNKSINIVKIRHKLEERIKNVNQLLTDTYYCKKGAYAVVESVGIDHNLQPEQIIKDIESAYERVYIPRLLKQLEVESDYVPAIDLFHGTVLLAAAFGAKVRFTDNEWPWAEPVLTSIREVDHIKKPDLKNNVYIKNYLDQVRWLQNKTENLIPIKIMDLQSPFTTATQLRHYEDFLIDMIDDPARVKKLLHIITEVSIEFMEIMSEVFTRPAYPGRNYPCVLDNIGICIADDAALIPLSPEMYEEFCLPTMQKIAREVEGIFLHSCGNYNHQVDKLLQIPNLRAIQMHSGPGEIDPRASWRKIRGNISLYSDTNNISLGDKYNGNYWKCYREYVLPRLLEADYSGLVLEAPPGLTAYERESNINKLKEIIDKWNGGYYGREK